MVFLLDFGQRLFFVHEYLLEARQLLVLLSHLSLVEFQGLGDFRVYDE